MRIGTGEDVEDRRVSGYPAGSVCSYAWTGLSGGRSLWIDYHISFFHRGLNPSTLGVECLSRLRAT